MVFYIHTHLIISMALKAGDKAPGFKLKDSLEKEVSLSEFKGKRIIL